MFSKFPMFHFQWKGRQWRENFSLSFSIQAFKAMISPINYRKIVNFNISDSLNDFRLPFTR